MVRSGDGLVCYDCLSGSSHSLCVKISRAQAEALRDLLEDRDMSSSEEESDTRSCSCCKPGSDKRSPGMRNGDIDLAHEERVKDVEKPESDSSNVL